MSYTQVVTSNNQNSKHYVFVKSSREMFTKEDAFIPSSKLRSKLKRHCRASLIYEACTLYNAL